MEFEKFIELKMSEFLEKRANEIADQENRMREEEFSMFEITSDYTKEIGDALKEGNIIKAKQVLEEVKNKYVQAPEGTISKKRLYAIMEDIYERIKDFEEGTGDKSLLQTIREYEEKGLFAKPEIFSSNEKDGIGIIISTITMKEKAIEEVTTKDSPTAEDVEKAAVAYHELKELVQRIPEYHSDLKSKAIERALNWFNAIKKIKSELYRSDGLETQEDPEKEIRDLENRLSDIRIIKENIVIAHQDIQECLDKQDISGCIKNYRKLKKLCESFPKELSEERIALLAEAMSVYEKIKSLRDILEPKSASSSGEISQAGHELLEGAASEMGSPEVAAQPEPAGSSHDQPHTRRLIDSVQKIRDDIAISERVIDDFLAQRDVGSAMKEYSRLKMLCKIFPKEKDPQEKVSILSTALASYEKIRKMKDLLEREEKARATALMELEAEKARFDAFRAELGIRLNHVKEFLAQKDSQNAMRAYSEMKDFFNTYPDEPFDEKKALFDDIINAHLDMALLDKDFKNKSIVSADRKVNEIREGIQGTKALISKGQVDEATHLILELKHRVLLLPSEEFDTKYDFMKDIGELEHNVVFSRNIHGLDAEGAEQR